MVVVVLLALLQGAAASSPTSSLQLAFDGFWKSQRWQPASGPLQPASNPGMRITRLEFLISDLAFQRLDGSWVESSSQDWQGFVSLNRVERSVIPPATGLGAEVFQRMRFKVGLPEVLNQGDPAQWAPGHPLHPETSGLHWGWQGGYVFLALEGNWQRPGDRAALGGFSFHLANAPSLTPIELPVAFQGGGPVTIRLGLDAHALLGTWDFGSDGTSTHSRPGDSLAPRLQQALKTAFRVVAVSQDTFQATASALAEVRPALPAGTQPYRLEVSRRLPQLSLPSDNPLTVQGVALGQRLFHDRRLSRNTNLSCASCHDPALAFSDARQVSLGTEGQPGRRQSMPLFNLGWASAYFWDGRASSLREQVLMPIQDPVEMHEDLEHALEKISDLGPEFERAFGSPERTADRLARALEQYLLTLISQDSRFDRAVRKVGSLTEEEKRGLQLFVTEHDPKRGLLGADCFHCHGGTLFTDHGFRNNGLEMKAEDLGRMLVTGDPADRGKFKTPSLRNIAVTAPYMHDGRFQTLEEVVAHYSGPMHRTETLDPNLAKHPEGGLNLSAADQRALVAFLKTLTDESLVATGAEEKSPAPKSLTLSSPSRP